MAVETRTIQIKTKGHTEMIDVTPHVSREIEASKIKSGIATLFVIGSTAGLTTMEYEPGLVKDLSRVFETIASTKLEYEHHLRWGDDNGHSHVRASLLGPSLTIPFVKKELQLGTWQQILFIDFDTQARARKIIVQILGE